MYNQFMSILIKDTTREERERIVAESIGDISGSCDGCMSGLVEMYQDYMEFRAHYESGMDGPAKSGCEHMG